MSKLMRRFATGLLALLALPTAMTSDAFGAFNSVPSAPSMQIGSATLAPATALGSSAGCRLLSLGPQVTLTWTASTSAIADGYRVLRSVTSGTGYTQVASVSGQSTSTYTDTTVVVSTTYYYVVTAYQGTSWTSVNSNQTSVATPAVCP